MYIPEPLKLNKFRDVVIPKAKEIYASYRERHSKMEVPSNQYSGDDYIPDLNKTEASDYLVHREEYEAMFEEEEKEK